MENVWGILIPAALTALTTLATLWVTNRNRSTIAERIKPYTDAIEQLRHTSDGQSDEMVRLQVIRDGLVKAHYDTHIATAGWPRLLLVVTVGCAIPIFAGSAVYFWQLIASPSNANDILRSSWLLLVAPLTALLILVACHLFAVKKVGDKQLSNKRSQLQGAQGNSATISAQPDATADPAI